MLTAIYNNLMTGLNVNSLNPKRLVHGRSELREHYSHMVKKNTLAPIYLLRFNSAKERFILDIKEESVALSALLQEMSEPQSEIFTSFEAVSDHPDLADAALLQERASSSVSWPPDPVSLRIHNLAATQQNAGNPVYPGSHILSPGPYHFQASVDEDLYQFQFHIKSDDTNRSILNKLSEFLSAAAIGIKSVVEELPDGRCRMLLESEESGGSFLFTLEDTEAPEDSRGLVDYFGLNQTERFPFNAHFSLNGMEKESGRNQFTLNRSLKIRLLEASDETVTIRCLPDQSRIRRCTDEFIERYNRLLTLSLSSGASRTASSSLSGALSAIPEHHTGKLEECGIRFEDKALAVDPEQEEKALKNGDIRRLFSAESAFHKELDEVLSSISLDPIHYVQKVVVAYPNTAKQNFLSPYAASLYSGLFYNNFL